MAANRNDRGKHPLSRLVLRIDADWQAMQAYYRGERQAVSGRALDGRRVVLPARALRPFLSQSGIHGLFEMTYDAAAGRLVDLKRIGD